MIIKIKEKNIMNYNINREFMVYCYYYYILVFYNINNLLFIFYMNNR